MIFTGVVAWQLTRKTIDRFDEWVGRPTRGLQTATPPPSVPVLPAEAFPRRQEPEPGLSTSGVP
jgi:hypothetical protein